MNINDFIRNFAGQFEETDPEVFTPETRFRDIDEWSSMLALYIMAMVDEEYEVKLTANEMRHANTVEDLFNIVKSHL